MLSEVRRLGKHSLIYGLGGVASQALGFLLLPVFTRLLSPAEYGIATLMAAGGAVAGLVFKLGLDAAALRFYYDHGEQRRRRELGSLWVFLSLSDLALALIAVGLARPLSAAVFGRPEYDVYLRIVLWTTLFRAASVLPLVYFRAEERSSRFVFYALGSALLERGLSLFFLLVLRRGLIGFLEGWLLGAAIYFFLYTRETMRRVRPALELPTVRSALAFGLPLVPHDLGRWALSLLDRFLLQRLASTAVVGLYAIGYGCASLMELALSAMMAAWMPVFLQMMRNRGEEALPRLARMLSLNFVVTTFLALNLCLFSPELVYLMTAPAYHTAHRVVPVVTLSYLFIAYYLSGSGPLLYLKRTSWLPVFTGVAVVANVLGNLAWIPRFGMMGAAWATVLAHALLGVAVLAHAWRVSGIPYEVVPAMKVAAAGAIAYLPGALALPLPLAARLPLKLGCLGLYFALLLLLRFLRPNELARLRALLSRGR